MLLSCSRKMYIPIACDKFRVLSYRNMHEICHTKGGRKLMSNFVSDDFTQKFMKGLKTDKYYLIGAECGSGKTTAIMEKLVPFARDNNKNVLYVCNRVTLKEQLYDKYNEEEIKETGVFKQNENLTIGMYQSITTFLEKKESIYK